MKKSFIATLVASSVLATSLIFAGCGEQTPTKMSANEIYAMGMVTAVNFLQQNSASANTLSSNLSDDTKQNLIQYVSMFENVLQNGGIHPIVTDNTSVDEAYSNYSKKMSITLGDEIYNMYYNETITGTEIEYNEDEIESETNSTLLGVVVMDNVVYNVVGGREVEENGVLETETEITLIISKEYIPISQNQELSSINLSGLNNYVKINQEIENNEIEYEYTTKYGNNLKTTNISWENERNRECLEIELEENGNKVEYEIRKLDQNKFRIEHENGNDEFEGTMEIVNGEWKFRNRNGQEI